jgi:hypothetical protein
VLGRPLLRQDAEDVLVGIAVVDLQGLARALGQVDVPTEGILLCLNAFRSRAKVVQPRLANDPDPGVGGEPLDLGLGRVELADGVKLGCLVRMECHATQQRGIPLDDLDGESRAREVAADLDHAGHADSRRVVDDGLDVRKVAAVSGDVEVGVVVDHRDRQRVRGRRSP